MKQTVVKGYTFYSTHIKSKQDALNMIKTFKELSPETAAFDTETTGLHIVLDKPFLFQFGFLDPNAKAGYTYIVDIEKQPIFARQVIQAWHKLVAKCKVYLGHNVKFDLHMLDNINTPYRENNISDTQFYIRYAFDAIATKNGGVPLKLKDFAAQYIDSEAKHHEHLLDKERSEKAASINNKLILKLKLNYKQNNQSIKNPYTKKAILDLFKDAISDYTTLPTQIRPIYLDWLQNDVPMYLQRKVTGLVDKDMIPYNTLNRNVIYTYGHYDIIYTLLTYVITQPAVIARQQEVGISFENKNIYPLLDMESCGFLIDKDYLTTSQLNLKEYIINRRKVLYSMAGSTVSVGQHAEIKKVLKEKYNLEVASTGKEELNLLVDNIKVTDKDNPAIQFIEIVQELRTLEKWYSTYIIRFLKDLQKTNRLYTQIHQVGTVSGRVSSDFQQFPSNGIVDYEGNELFTPRRMVLTDSYTVYLDYSQIELRFQAFYTILVGHPDINLCQAYMPYKCVNSKGILFDYKNPEHIKNWNSGDWYYEGTDKHWIPTDIHGKTTEEATGLKPEDEGFAKARKKIGKRTNFAKNYGAQRAKIRVMYPDKTEDEIDRINDAYYKAFPGVKLYHQYCYDRAGAYTYTENLFGIKYYGVSGHKLINLLVQGSAAFYLKWKIAQIYDYIKENNLTIKLQMQIHDELSFICNPEDTKHMFNIKKIMEDWEDAFVPVVADMEVTSTTWYNKEEVTTLDELQKHFSS